MHGIGELFGSAFDDVIRRPLPAVIPALVDLALLLAGALVYSAALGVIVFAQAPQALPAMPFAVPEALPSVADLRDSTGLVLDWEPRAWLALGALAAVALPLAAFARGGFIGVLLEAYLRRRDDPLDAGPTHEGLVQAFLDHGSRSFGPLLLIGLLEAVVAVGAVVLPQAVPYFRNSLLGLIAFDFLFMFAPFIVVVEGSGAASALRRSVRTVSDFLASSLVALLFGLLTTGGFAALLAPLVAFFGQPGLLLGAVLYSPLGTVLALFYLKVYLSFRPHEAFPAGAKEAPAKAAAPSEA